MRTSHIVAFVALSVWCVVAVWVGADEFGIGECVAVALIEAGLLVAFALLKAVNEARRDGRSTLSVAATCGLVAFLVSFLIAPPRGGTIMPRAGETYDAFIARAVQEIANARA